MKPPRMVPVVERRDPRTRGEEIVATYLAKVDGSWEQVDTELAAEIDTALSRAAMADGDWHKAERRKGRTS